jgi:hypothetical protein
MNEARASWSTHRWELILLSATYPVENLSKA